MPPTPKLIAMLGVLVACGGGHAAPHDATTAIDAGILDGAVDGPTAVDAGVDADLSAYIPQPPVAIPPAPPAQDVTNLPLDEQGRPILADGETYHLVDRPPDALSALSDCAAMIVRCVDPAVRGRTLDACAISPPRCATAQPWLEAPCCPTPCIARYQQLRTDGMPPITAFRAALYGHPSCAPGVDAIVGGAP